MLFSTACRASNSAATVVSAVARHAAPKSWSAPIFNAISPASSSTSEYTLAEIEPVLATNLDYCAFFGLHADIFPSIAYAKKQQRQQQHTVDAMTTYYGESNEDAPLGATFAVGMPPVMSIFCRMVPDPNTGKMIHLPLSEHATCKADSPTLPNEELAGDTLASRMEAKSLLGVVVNAISHSKRTLPRQHATLTPINASVGLTSNALFSTSAPLSAAASAVAITASDDAAFIDETFIDVFVRPSTSTIVDGTNQNVNHVCSTFPKAANVLCNNVTVRSAEKTALANSVPRYHEEQFVSCDFSPIEPRTETACGCKSIARQIFFGEQDDDLTFIAFGGVLP